MEQFLEILAETHIQLGRIYLFFDGNGRIGRMILMYLSMVPVIISKEERARYIKDLAEQNMYDLTYILYQSYQFEKERIIQFNE